VSERQTDNDDWSKVVHDLPYM